MLIRSTASAPRAHGLLLLCVLASVAGAGAARAAEAAPKKLKVFILAGQSNMEGPANVSTFDYIGDDPATAPLLKMMRGSDGKPTVCDGVWISYLTGAGADNFTLNGKLTAGYGSMWGQDRTKPGTNIGPEFTFGLTTDAAFEEPVLLIKTAWGGKSLNTDFRPPSAGPYVLPKETQEAWDKHPQGAHGIPKAEDRPKIAAEKAAATGVYYRLMIEHVKKVLADPRQVIPDYDPAQGYEIAGFAWLQGWNDAVDGQTYPRRHQPDGYAMYSDLLAHFIRDVRKDLDAPKMPFVIGVMGVGGLRDPSSATVAFRKAMAAPADMPEFKGNVTAVQTAPFWPDELTDIEAKRVRVGQMRQALDSKHKDHANADGTMTDEQKNEFMKKFEADLISPAEAATWKRGVSNAGYHYLGCAKIFALMGKHFAEANLALLKAGHDSASKTDTSASTTDKTLVAWVAPSNLDQQGGSVLTIQEDTRFDAIVFGERARGKWMAGSEGFSRTQTNQDANATETAGPDALVQLAIVYQGNTVRLYRNGAVYAEYTAQNIDLLKGSDHIAVFGLRHLGAGSGTPFAGAIEDARIYSRPLSAEEIGSLKPDVASDIAPLAWWDFEGEAARDRAGHFAHHKAEAGATIKDGRLVLDGKGSLVAACAERVLKLAAGGGTPQWPEQPPANWVTFHLAHPGPGRAEPGDPNCIFDHKGKVHLHYIYATPAGPAFGHVSSDDMVHWKWHDTVLAPPTTGHGMFSGTGFYTREGRPAIIYHAWGRGRNVVHHPADDTFDSWTEPEIVMPKKADGSVPDIRHWDPDCWLMNDTYYAYSGGQNPQLMKSPDLKEWAYLGDLLHPDHPSDLGIPKEEDISCGNMFKIGDKWMLLCISHSKGARYYLGDFKDEKYLPTFHAMMSFGSNTFFAPESVLTRDGRRVMWAWLMGLPISPTGVQSLPRELELPADGVLRIKPLRELASLRSDEHQETDVVVGTDAPHRLKDIRGDALEMEVTFKAPAAKEFGLDVLCDKSGANGLRVAYAADTKTLKVGAAAAPFELNKAEDLVLRVFIDRNLVEVFANDRQAVVAANPLVPGNLDVSLFSKGGDVVAKSVKAWKIKSIYPAGKTEEKRQAREDPVKGTSSADGTMLRDKTLVAWVRLADLVQTGSGVLAIQDGDEFDAITFGERAAGRWMAGSSGFSRTQSPAAQQSLAQEAATPDQWLQVAVVYRGKQIEIWRDGRCYASYEATNQQTYPAKSDVYLGLRCLVAQSHGYLKGAIDEARIYDTALGGEALSQLKPGVLTVPKPLGWWIFDGGSVKDGMGHYPDARLIGTAKIKNGALVLDGQGYAHVSCRPSTVQAGFFTPSRKGQIWDTWAYFHEGRYYLYYLAGNFNRWDGHELALSDDGVHWKEQGVLIKPRAGVTWMGTGHIWKSPDFGRNHTWVINYSEWFGDKQDIMFATSTNLLDWTKVDEKHRFVQDTRWYKEKGRWDCIDTVVRPDGSLYGYFTADPDPAKVKYRPCGFGFAESKDGITWTALPPIEGDVSGEFGGIQKIGDKYYIIISEGRVAVGDKPEGPFLAQKKNSNVFGAGCDIYFPRFFHSAPGGPLVNHFYTSGAVSAAPFKDIEIDREGILRLKWWKNNDAMKANPVKVSLVPAGEGYFPSLKMLDWKPDPARTTVIEGTIVRASAGTGDASSPRIFFDQGGGKGQCLVFSKDKVTFGNIDAAGGEFKPAQTSARGMEIGAEARFRLLIRENMIELYVNDYLMNLKRVSYNGRIGFMADDRQGGFKDISVWQSK